MQVLLAALAFLGVTGVSQLALVQGTVPAEEPAAYTQEDQHLLVTPAVVRILHAVKGTLVIQPFELDNERLLVVPISDLEPVVIDIDEMMSGTGFVVSEDGVVVTNAHVASDSYVEYMTVISIFAEILYDEVILIMMEYGQDSPEVEEYIAQFESFATDAETPQMRALRESLLSMVTINNEKGGVVVLEQGMKAPAYGDLYSVGYPVKTYVADDWLDTGKDVAVLTFTRRPNIPERSNDSAVLTTTGTNPNLPAVSLAATSTLDINSMIAVYGFPGSTDMGMSTVTHVTVTQGRVTSHKQVSSGSFRAYQVDAKVSKGSSGGPVVDEHGRVIGIMTLETGAEDGDNFGFALPITVVHELLEEAGVQSVTTQYQASVREGLSLQDARHCERAQESFAQAHTFVAHNSNTRTSVERAISECKKLIASGQSIDSVFDEFWEKVRSVNAFVWLLVGGGLAMFVVVAVGASHLWRRLEDGQEQIDALEEEIEDREHTEVVPPTPQPTAAAPPPQQYQPTPAAPIPSAAPQIPQTAPPVVAPPVAAQPPQYAPAPVPQAAAVMPQVPQTPPAAPPVTPAQQPVATAPQAVAPVPPQAPVAAAPVAPPPVPPQPPAPVAAQPAAAPGTPANAPRPATPPGEITPPAPGAENENLGWYVNGQQVDRS